MTQERGRTLGGKKKEKKKRKKERGWRMGSFDFYFLSPSSYVFVVRGKEREDGKKGRKKKRKGEKSASRLAEYCHHH